MINSLVKPITKTEFVIQDITNNGNFFNVITLSNTNRMYLPMLNDIVVLPISSANNGFIFNKTHCYIVSEIKNDFEKNVLVIFLART